MLNPWAGLAGLPRDVWVLFGVTLVNRAGTMVMPFLALYVAEARGLGLGRESAGVVLAAYGAVALAMGPIAGRLADRVGAVRVMRASLLGSGLVLLTLPHARTLGALVAVTLAWAATAELLRPAAMAIVGDAVPPERRRSAFAVNRLAVNLGMSVGPVAGGFLAERSYALLFYVDGGTSIAAGCLLCVLPLRLAWAVPKGADVSRGPVSERRRVRDRRLLWVLAAILPVGLVFFQLSSTLPLYLKQDLGLRESTIGLVLCTNTILIVLVEVPLTTRTSTWSPRVSLSSGSALVAVGFGALAFVVGPATAVASVVVWTVGEMVLFPAMSAYVTELAPDAQRGRYMGLYAMTFAFAFAIGPWAGTLLLDGYGGPVLWGTCLVVGMLSAAMFWRIDNG